MTPQFPSQNKHYIDPLDVNLLYLNFLIVKCGVQVVGQIRRGYLWLATRKVVMLRNGVGFVLMNIFNIFSCVK